MIRLTSVSYIVLGLVAWLEEATPYDLKKAAAASVGNLWSVQHAQLYSEPERLAAAGLLDEEREERGRRRRTYRLTAAGREALDAWLASPPDADAELRDPGLLKLFFGADPATLAAAEVERHRSKLDHYEQLHAASAGTMPRGARLTLECGIAHERVWVEFWSRLAGYGRGTP